MNWIVVIPLIIDVLKEATKLISTIEDKAEKDSAKDNLRAVLKDYDDHKDVPTLRTNILQAAGNGGSKR